METKTIMANFITIIKNLSIHSALTKIPKERALPTINNANHAIDCKIPRSKNRRLATHIDKE